MNPREFETPLQKLIAGRRSRRTFEKRPVEPKTLSVLREYCEALATLESPFGHRARFGIIDKQAAPDEPVRLGTYGILKNPRYFLYGAIPESRHAYASYGYLFEHIILKASDLGLGTCWLGYFQRSGFLREIAPSAGEVVPAVSPVGYASPTRSVYEGIIQRVRSPAMRKPWNELFFAGDFAHPLDASRTLNGVPPAASGAYAGALEMVRLAPSAGNLQPWRIVARSGPTEIMFFLDRSDSNRGYDKRNLQGIDIGIAMCHFDLAVRAAGLAGTWLEDTDGLPAAPERTEYVLSWRAAREP